MKIDAERLKEEVNSFFAEAIVMGRIMSDFHSELGTDPKTMEMTQLADRDTVLEIIDNIVQEAEEKQEESKPKLTIEQWYDLF